MKTHLFAPIITALGLCIAPLHGAAPVVSNLTAAQRAGTKLVDISYDVTADTPTVATTLEVSSDGGVTFSVPATSLSGAIGEGVATGTGKTITWDVGADWNQQVSSTMRFKVIADDGVPTGPAGMALIPAGSFTMGRTSGDTDSNAPHRHEEEHLGIQCQHTES
jgi:hypothetical protein